MGKVIAIVSGKGGVGKTTTAINLTYAFTAFHRNAVLIEANLRSPHIGIILGFPILEKTLHKVLEKKYLLKDSFYLHYSGLKVLLAHMYGVHHVKTDTFDILDKSLKEMRNLVELAVLDTPPCHVPETYHSVKAADYVLIVTTPDLPSVSEILKSIKMAKHLNKEILGVVVTRKTGKTHEMTNAHIQKLTGYSIIGEIPEDEHVPLSVQLKYPVTFAYGESKASVAYKKLAAKLIGKDYKNEVMYKNEDIFDKLAKRVK